MQSKGEETKVPPHISATFESEECGVDGCEEVRYSRIGMEYHRLRDH